MHEKKLKYKVLSSTVWKVKCRLKQKSHWILCFFNRNSGRNFFHLITFLHAIKVVKLFKAWTYNIHKHKFLISRSLFAVFSLWYFILNSCKALLWKFLHGAPKVMSFWRTFKARDKSVKLVSSNKKDNQTVILKYRL